MNCFAPLAACLGLTACADETLSAYADRAATYHLVEIDGAATGDAATIRFPEQGRIAGRGPCNAFTARQVAPYPWFKLADLSATERACPALDAEAAFFDALSAMTIAEVSGPTLLLSNEAGRTLFFLAR